MCISFLIPQRFVEISKAQPLDIREEVEQLADGIEVLKEEEIIELAEAETLEEKLAQLQAEASGEDPVKNVGNPRPSSGYPLPRVSGRRAGCPKRNRTSN